MGGCESKGGAQGARKVPKKKAQAPPKKKLNPADYTFSKKIDEVLVKQEGSIAGEQFNIEECKNCDIFLLDYIATSFVDDCQDCRIYIGPVETSVFVRNCSNCSPSAGQQYRCRDCQDCNIALFCGTEPIIESSQKMQFACFDFNYFSLRGQMASAGLKPWNNKWWMIYDFNKNEEKPNWSLLPQEEAGRLLNVEAAGVITPEELENESVVPLTLGSRPWPSKETCFIVFMPDSEAFIEAFLSKSLASKWAIARTRVVRLQDDQLKTLFTWAKEPKLLGRCKGEEITGIQVCGENIQKQVQDALALTGLATGAKNIRVIPQKDTEALATHFFQTWKDEV
ncbi:Protein XRP2 [Durusdinium trenchii]|uniref:Protein XRP2 n=1 Tax=Durusdinium trenchii TaxID=1381693 RepID=A0ABP0JYC2_9DINO